MNIAQQIVNGIVLGSGYACIAIGWTILLGVARLVNFAHGQLYMLGAFVTWYAVAKAGLPYPLAIVAAMVVLAVLGLLIQGAMMRLVMTQNLTSLMIVTLGLGYPRGPLALGDSLGASVILTILRNMFSVLGDPRYRPSPWLARRAQLGLSLTQRDAAHASAHGSYDYDGSDAHDAASSV